MESSETRRTSSRWSIIVSGLGPSAVPTVAGPRSGKCNRRRMCFLTFVRRLFDEPCLDVPLPLWCGDAKRRPIELLARVPPEKMENPMGFGWAESRPNISPDFRHRGSYTYWVPEYSQYTPMYHRLGVPELPGIPGAALR